jgi:hypothetical protein
MTHLSDHDLWGAGGHRVATMAPGPDDLFVVTLMFGKTVLVDPIDQYDRTVRVAEAFARRIVHDRPVTIKVIPLSFRELLAHEGTTREEVAKTLTPADRAADRLLITDACWKVLRESNDPKVRADALELLTGMGVSKQ